MDINKTTATRCALYLSLLAPFFLSACGGGSSSGSDTTPPTVSSTTPADTATGVARNSIITATFDEDIFATTVDAASFTLAKPGAGSISSSVSFDGASNVASLNPDNALAILATYTATLTPAITDLSGNALAANYSWSFSTADGLWGSAELIETDNTETTSSPQIAVDNNGNALTVWFQHDGTRWNIWANRFDGTSWGIATLIETNDAGGAFDPQIAVDNSGNALAVWSQFGGAGPSIWANRFDGTIWGIAAVIETGTGAANNPQIAVDSSGNALAVWRQSDGTRNNIWANRFDGMTWGVAAQIETGTGNAFDPQIAVDNSGNALAVWFQFDGGTRHSIWANRFDGANWGMTVLVESDAGNAVSPQIAVDNSGNVLAVWRQFDGTRDSIWTNRFNGTSWGTPALIDTDNTGTANFPQIAVDSSGNALAVWHQFNGAVSSIWANRFDGTSWGTSALIETGTGTAINPQIAVNNNGDALAVWYQQVDGGPFSIWANRFD